MSYKKNSILIIGGGGREHALGWKLAKSAKVGTLYFAPGNGGTARIGKNILINALDIPTLVDFAIEKHIDLTVVGPEDALALGVVDAFQKKGLAIFGPTKKAAQIESSKAFAKELMQSEDIPAPWFESFTDPEKANLYIKQQRFPIVIKANGLAQGEGVTVVINSIEGQRVIDDIMVKKIFGDAGSRIVVEQFLYGREISVHALCDGEHITLFPVARDHKAVFQGNRGPNTGGMGAIAPVEGLEEIFLHHIKQTFIEPALEGLKKKGSIFKGLLYPGLIITTVGPMVLEFNARFGDPETQTYMRLLKTDLFDILMSYVNGNLDKIQIEWEKKYACCIVLAAGGYPGEYKKGEIIYGLEKAAMTKDVVVFHAGTREINEQMHTNGGRVLGITATGDTLAEALQKAYSVIGGHGVHFSGMHYRKDIGRI